MIDLQIDNPIVNSDDRHLVLDNVSIEDVHKQIDAILKESGRLFVSFAEYG